MNQYKYAHLLALLAAVMALGGCMTVSKPLSKHQMTTPFDEKVFAPYAIDGSGGIRGQAFQKTRGGEVKYAAGNTVTLIPVTSYSREVWEASLRGEVTDKDPQWDKYIRKATADGSGNFEFSKIPTGEYYLECPIFWEVTVGQYGSFRTGGVVKKQIKVGDGEVVKVILTE